MGEAPDGQRADARIGVPELLGEIFEVLRRLDGRDAEGDHARLDGLGVRDLVQRLAQRFAQFGCRHEQGHDPRRRADVRVAARLDEFAQAGDQILLVAALEVGQDQAVQALLALRQDRTGGENDRDEFRRWDIADALEALRKLLGLGHERGEALEGGIRAGPRERAGGGAERAGGPRGSQGIDHRPRGFFRAPGERRGSLVADGVVLVLEEGLQPSRCLVAASDFQRLGGGGAEFRPGVLQPFLELGGVHLVFQRGQSHEGASPNPRTGLFIDQQSAGGPETVRDTILRKVMQRLRLENPVVGFELLKHASGSHRSRRRSSRSRGSSRRCRSSEGKDGASQKGGHQKRLDAVNHGSGDRMNPRLSRLDGFKKLPPP